ncbi:MAG: ABC transporter permease subunit [Phycisphaeraceae bacterium JB051]
MNRAIINQLVLKEIRESFSGFCLGLFLIGGFTFLSLHSRLIPDFNTLGILVMMSIIFALMWGMSPIGGERQAGTIGLLLALPINPRLFFAVKMIVAMMCVLLPITLSYLLFSVIASDREISLQISSRMYLCMSLISVLTLFWTICIGIRQPTEARVFLLAMAVYFGGWFILMILDLLRIATDALMIKVIAFTPFALMILGDTGNITPEEKRTLLFAIVFNSLVTVGLNAWAVHRLPKPVKTRG